MKCTVLCVDVWYSTHNTYLHRHPHACIIVSHTHIIPNTHTPPPSHTHACIHSPGLPPIATPRQIILLALVVHALTHWELHPLAKTVSYGTGLYFFLGVLMDGPGTLLTWVLGVPLAPHFNNPFGATSLGDLWGRRWNLTAGGSLRRLLYDPMVEGVLVKQRGLAPARRVWMRAPAALLSFVVSGVMHEVLWWYITGATTPNLAWFWFFTVHGLACVVEEVVRVVLRRNGVLLENRVLGWVWTMGFFIATGHLLFVPPPERAGVAAMVVKSLRVMYDALSRALLVLYVTPVAPT